jgi:hypothetical protein
MRRFRHLRRLTAIVANLLLLQLAFASGAGACPMGDEMHATGASTAGAVHAPHHVASAVASNSGISTAPASHHHAGGACNMACPTATCTAAGHCSTSMTTRADPAMTAFPAAAAPAQAPTADMPLSASPAPEPPPPRV